ncbi:MAG: DUF3108 domain-containing protein [Acidobacteria bacterium]|nr:MAG: DUF3108 domain-containing protein [Acidobacteriota bacterium]RPJ84408.1 MAG: DUF3108 domain-containing protein [Acidobacteriota bacterium]
MNLWILGWDLSTIARDPAALVDGRVFNANIFFPAAQTLAYSDHLILQALAAWPAWALTGNLSFCYNALLFGSWVAGAFSMCLLARELTGSRFGAFVAGLAWGFWPFRSAHLLHLQLQSLYFLPVAFLFLHRVVAARRRRDAMALGAFAALQAISAVYWGVIGALALVVGAAALVLTAGRFRSGVLFRRFLLAGAVGAVLVAPFVIPYWKVQQREGFARNMYEAARHEATWTSYLHVPPGNLLYGRTGLLRPPAGAPPSRHEGPEQELFPGFALLALSIYGARRAWKADARPVAAVMLAVAALGFVLSLGPDGVRPLYAWLHRWVFGFQAIRAPARFGVLVTFGLAVLAAIGLRELAARRHGRLLATVVCAVVALEYLNVPLPSVPAPSSTTPAGKWLAGAQGEGAVLYLPLDADLGNTRFMLESLEHRRPIVNGYSGQRPAFFMGFVDTLNLLPSPEALWALRDLGVRFVVSPAPLLDGAAATEEGLPVTALPLVERARFEDALVYEVSWSEEAETLFPRPEPPAPEDPGAVPFPESERLAFEVMWQSAATVGLPAGDAALTASRTAEGAAPDGAAGGWHLAVELRTAPWVSRFFEAHDRLETWTDALLLPLRHEEHLREGRRVVDRVTVYDHDRRTVRVGDGPGMPLPRAARDGLAAFLYARTLPLVPGFEAQFPVIEGGRWFLVTLRAVGIERIRVGGREVEALRVEPRIAASGGKQRSLSATLFVTTDERRLPLLMLVDAGFGSFRLELVDHESR